MPSKKGPAFIVIAPGCSDDEEPLIPTARQVKHEKSVRQNEENALAFSTIEKPPNCGICFNTRCGAYFVAALQVAYGAMHLVACMAYVLYGKDVLIETAQNEEELEEAYFNRDIRLYWSAFVATFVVISGMLTFYGLNAKRARLLRPAVFLYLMGIVTFILQLIAVLVYWDTISLKVRDVLKYYCTDIEQEFQNEIASEQNLNQNTLEAKTDLAAWQQIEFMVQDDDTWNNYTQGYLMTLISGICMFNVTLFSWFCWTLLAQMTWMIKRGQY